MPRKVWSVSGLVSHLVNLIDQEEALRSFWIEGEISNFTHHSSGHMYFTLKDERTKIKVVMFSRYNRLLLFKPKNGDRVHIRGELYVYEREGQVQIKAWEMRNSGVGDLYTAYLQLKEKLEKEGLFEREKRKIPRFPKRVGIVTSERGAAVRDIITTISRRYPETQILLYPVTVQGSSAADEVSHAIDQMNAMQAADLLIVGRGGGSLEELWAFNEEKVVRSIAYSSIPVISAVGHETDTTLSDYAADLRAATPTAAAEMAVPDRTDLEERLASATKRLQQNFTHRLDQAERRFMTLWDRPIFRQPGAQLDQYSQRIDYLERDLEKTIQKHTTTQNILLERLVHRLQFHHPEIHVKQWRDQLQQLEKELLSQLLSLLRDREAKFQHLVSQLDALSPLKVMQRGYSLVYPFHTSQLIRTVKEVNPGDLIRVRLTDGELKCQVWKTEENSYE